MKKTVTLVTTIVLSLVMFMSNVTGLVMVTRAEGYVVRAEEGEVVDEISEGGQDEAAIEEELRRQQEEEEARRQAEERAAREAEEETARQREEEAAKEAIRQAEEAEKRAAEEAEKARQEEEARKAAESSNLYSIAAFLQSKPITKLDFGAAEVGVERDYFPIVIQNTGNTPVKLIYCKYNDPDGAFSVTLRGDKTELAVGESASLYVSISSFLKQGTYKATLMFADADKDPNYTKGLMITLKGTVTGKQEAVTNVQVSPSKVTLATGGSYQFNATVQGTGTPSQDVRWSVNNHRSSGTSISSSGLLTLGSDETSASISVVATSVENSAISGSAVVSPQINSYNVSVNADPVNGGSISGGGAVSEGGSVTLSAVPNKNFYFVGWFVGGNKVSTATNFTVNDVRSNTNVTAKFAQNYVTVKAEPNNKDAGNVVGGGNVTYGSSTTLSAKAYSGYVFTGWKEGDTIISRDASISLKNLTTDRKITAMFSKTSYTITMAASPIEGGKVSGGGTIALGSGTTLKAEPSSGYEFREWQVNGQVVSRDASYKVDKVEQDYTITAIFAKKGITSYEISAGVATTGGSITPSGKTLVAEGTNLTYTMTPKSGFAILAVAVDGVQVGNVSTYTFTNVRGPHTIAVAFVQTEAASKKAGAQEKKVQAVPKTESNTATSQSTVDIAQAATGAGGDTYVEEIDGLDEIYVPSDEELGVTDTEGIEFSSPLMKYMGVSMDEINNMIAAGEKGTILNTAFYTGNLDAYVTNTLEPKNMDGIDYNNMSREELIMVSEDEMNPSFPNLDTVVEDLLTTEDALTVAKGGHVDVAISLTKEEASNETKKIMQNAVGQVPVQYFDFTFLKSNNGYTERVTELPSLMQVIVEIPDEVYKSGKTYSILRVHNGSLSVLPDIDDDPKTITFYTDRFSSYAIAREVTTSRNLVTWMCLGAAITFAIAMTCFAILLHHQRKMRLARAKARRANSSK